MSTQTQQRGAMQQQAPRQNGAITPAPQQQAPAQQQRGGKSPLAALLENRKLALSDVCTPVGLNPDRVIRTIILAVRKTPKLAECDPESVFTATMELARLGFEPGGAMGHAALVPYGRECQPQVMYQGLIDLAYRSGFVKDMNADVVRAGDEFSRQSGDEPRIFHRPSLDPDRENKPWTHVYCIITTATGGKIMRVMDRAAVLKRKAMSKSAGRSDSPWKTHEVAMAIKTVIRDALRTAPKSVELRKAMSFESDAIDTTATDVTEAARGNGGLLAGARTQTEAHALPPPSDDYRDEPPLDDPPPDDGEPPLPEIG